MSFMKVVPKGFKWIECKHGIGGMIPPIRYIPMQDPMQDALKKTKTTTYFKWTLVLLNKRNELKVAIWAPGTPKQFLLHGHTVIHV